MPAATPAEPQPQIGEDLLDVVDCLTGLRHDRALHDFAIRSRGHLPRHENEIAGAYRLRERQGPPAGPLRLNIDAFDGDETLSVH
jgi:hypothetical protein